MRIWLKRANLATIVVVCAAWAAHLSLDDSSVPMVLLHALTPFWGALGLVTLGAAVPAFAYRTTMRCAVTPGGLGLRSGASHRVVPLDGCLVAHPLLDDLLGHVAVTGADEITLRVSSATGERNALAHARGRDQPRFGRVPDDVGIGQRATITERVGGADLVVSAGSFFQSGPAAANVLVDAVRRASGTLADGPVVDAYGGVGLFGVCVSRGPVVVVESSRSACADARRNLRGRPDATVVCSTVEDWTPTPAPLVIADPARAGLGRAGVGVVAAAASRRVVLVSCDPVAMARDAALLAESGLREVESRLDLAGIERVSFGRA